MNYVIRRWYDIGLVLASAAITWAIVGDLSTLQLILLLNFVVLVCHQLEELRWPGGTPWVLNEVFNRWEDGLADRYPLNQANCAVINIAGWVFYLIPVFAPGLIWFGIAQILFGMVGQFITHGIVTNLKLKTLYNPGLAAVVLGHIPLGIWYLVEVHGQGLASGWDWLFGVLLLAAFAVIGLNLIGYKLLSDKNTRYPFEPSEMNRWDRSARLERAGITPLPLGATDPSGTGAGAGATRIDRQEDSE